MVVRKVQLSVLKAMVALLSLSFLSYVLNLISPWAAVPTSVLALLALVSLASRATNFGVDPSTCIVVGNHKVNLSDVLYIYEDNAGIIIKMREAQRIFIFRSYFHFIGNEIFIDKYMIKEPQALSNLLEKVPCARKSFLLRRILYYFTGVNA